MIQTSLERSSSIKKRSDCKFQPNCVAYCKILYNGFCTAEAWKLCLNLVLSFFFSFHLSLVAALEEIKRQFSLKTDHNITK